MTHVPADVERVVVDYLAANIDEPTVTVEVGVPANFRPTTSRSHLQVDSFVPFNDWPISTRPVVRLIAYAVSTTEAKRVAAKAYGILATGEGTDSISQVRPLNGPDPARDDRTHAEIASVELSVAIRTIDV